MKIDQTERFKSLDQSTQDGICAILMSQDSVTLEIRHQTDIVLGSSRQDHIKTRNVTQRSHDQILEALHQLAPSGNDGQKASVSQSSYSAGTRARDTLLEALAFEVMTDRHEQINDSYKDTFEWVYQEPKNSTRPWSNFSSWLKASNSDLYWINGKAGSGKSTLMNFLSDHNKTNSLLSFWCGESSLVSASFYFWNSGAVLQRTQRGLLRALLYQIVKVDSRLISIAFPDYLSFEYSRNWKAGALEDALRRVCQQKSLPIKLFLLVDGLDEYDGDHWNLATLFKDLSSSPNAKICVSSRPLLVFDKAFEGSPTLRLEYLTYGDIQYYVTDKLGGNQLMRNLRHAEGDERTDKILTEIVQKAKGVFLWVEIVVKSLIAGLTNEDSLSILRSRVEELPTELEGLYAHMMKNINSTYRQRPSFLFSNLKKHLDSIGKY